MSSKLFLRHGLTLIYTVFTAENAERKAIPINRDFHFVSTRAWRRQRRVEKRFPLRRQGAKGIRFRLPYRQVKLWVWPSCSHTALWGGGWPKLIFWCGGILVDFRGDGG